MIEFLSTNKDITAIEDSCVVIGFFEDEPSQYDSINQLIKQKFLNPKLEKTQYLNHLEGFKASQIILLGLGEKENFKAKQHQKTILSLMACVKANKIQSLTLENWSVNEKEEAWITQQSVKLIQDSLYQVQKVFKEAEKLDDLKQVYLKSNNTQAILEGQSIANGIALTKELADLPSNVCTPTYLSEVAQKLAKKYSLKCEVLEEKQMQDLGMGSLLSVSKGSIEKPKLITLEYSNNGKAKPIVLVGKGVTFDSGGISLKPGSAMDEMKYDMCGAASVLGVMDAVAQMKLNVNLVIVVAAVENMPAANASKPGDVVQSMSGQTIEILNTDAEGRLILCDALTFVEKFNPEVVIDIATLTGAVIMALGKHHSGLMSNNEKLTQDLITSGKTSQDTLWQLPLDEEFDELLKSNFADMANIGGREAGSVTAGCFLARFTKKYHWAHLDIAGTAWVSGAKKGATGRPVSLLTQYIIDSIKPC
jgi:leucyl aminopeptidase